MKINFSSNRAMSLQLSDANQITYTQAISPDVIPEERIVLLNGLCRDLTDSGQTGQAGVIARNYFVPTVKDCIYHGITTFPAYIADQVSNIVPVLSDADGIKQ